MKLSQLIKALGVSQTYGKENDFEVRGVTGNSKKVRKDFIFVAVKGTRVDGHGFIQEAIRNGAGAIIIQSPEYKRTNQDQVMYIKTVDSRKALARLVGAFYGDPSSRMKVVGITGTNGKTTISYLIEALLKDAGRNPAVIGTINYRFKGSVAVSWNTTPGAEEIQEMFYAMAKQGVDYVVMEVSSHALDQARVEGIRFSTAIFTNVTQDHLDYHTSMENYFLTKARLFEGLTPGSFAIINSDDAYGRRLVKVGRAEILTYGIDTAADVMAEGIIFGVSHTEFTVKTKHNRMRLKTRLIGKYNVYNILAAVAFGLKEGLDSPVIQSSLEQFSQVPGRLERIESEKGFSVFVDYAHTDDALKNVIKALREISRGRIIVVFGCGGQRDKGKRPKMGYVVSELADYAIITNDNPRSEDPQEIIEQIKAGIKKDNYCVIPDRYEAIKKSLTLAHAEDIVLLAGKGHEDYQVYKDEKIHFDDREVVKECLRQMN